MPLQITIIINPSDTEAGSFDIYQFIYDNNGDPQAVPFLLESNVPESSLISPGYTVMADENAYGIRLVNNNDRGFGCDTSFIEKFFSNVKIVNNFSKSYGSMDIIGVSFSDITLPLQNGSPIYYHLDTGTTVSGTTIVELNNNELSNTLSYTLTIRDSDSISPFVYSNSIPPSSGITINAYNTFLSPDRQFIISLDSNIPSTPSQTPTPTRTPMPTPTLMPTPSVSVSPTITLSTTPSITITSTPTMSSTPPITITPTPTITTTPSTSCTRPGGLNSYDFLFAYSGSTGPINFTSTQESACIGLSKLGSTEFYGETGEATGLTIGSAVYIYNPPSDITSCRRIEDGYYVMIYPSPVVIYIFNGVIDSYPVCPAPTPSITITPSITPSITPTITPSITLSITPSVTLTPSITITPTITPSVIPPSVGNFIIDPAYGIKFSGVTGTGIPLFSYPVTGGNTTLTYTGTISDQYLSIDVYGTPAPSGDKHLVLKVNGYQVDVRTILSTEITETMYATKTLHLPLTIAPTEIIIRINS